jgi:phage tail-like protein
MAETGSRQDPYVAFRFQVKLDDFTVAGFSECTGLQMETEIKDYLEGGLNTHVLKFPGRTKHGNLTFKRGIVDKNVWQWCYDLTRGIVKRRGGSIQLFDPSGEKVVMEYQFSGAFPVKWQGPDMNATQNNVAMETLELCHQGLKREI